MQEPRFWFRQAELWYNIDWYLSELFRFVASYFAVPRIRELEHIRLRFL